MFCNATHQAFTRLRTGTTTQRHGDELRMKRAEVAGLTKL